MTAYRQIAHATPEVIDVEVGNLKLRVTQQEGSLPKTELTVDGKAWPITSLCIYGRAGQPWRVEFEYLPCRMSKEA